jgi:putative oxidoreductase
MTFFQRLLSTKAPAAVILIRLIVGSVFLSEGIQKFLLPEALGVGRFTKIGIPNAEVLAPFVGVCEIVCGVLFILGLLLVGGLIGSSREIPESDREGRQKPTAIC